MSMLSNVTEKNSQMQIAKKIYKTKIEPRNAVRAHINNFKVQLRNQIPQLLFYTSNDEIILKMSEKNIDKLLVFLEKNTLCQYKILVDACCIDFIELKQRFEVCYNLLSTYYNTRINVTVSVDETTPVPTASLLFKSANWAEREIWDMNGIFFYKHPDLRRILTDYGFKGHPLRKDFPLTGYIETAYSFAEKRVLRKIVSLSQQNRIYNYNATFFFKGQYDGKKFF